MDGVLTRAVTEPSQSFHFTITEKAPTKAFSLLKEPTSAFTILCDFENFVSCPALVLTRESGDVHDGDVPRLEDDHGESPGGRLVTQRQQQLAPTSPCPALLL